MAITVKHSKVSTIPDDADTSLVRPSDWNADHALTGVIDVANGGTGAATLTGYVKGNGTSAMTAVATVPSTDITGLGTMATQNANAVAITGGTIDNTTIGATTATTGAFTTLTSTGGAVNGTIGATTPAAGTFTTITGQTARVNGTGQNLLTYSQAAFNTNWLKSGTPTVSDSSTTAPDSTSTASTLTCTTTSDYIYQSQTIVVGSTYTWSIYVKNSTATTSLLWVRNTSQNAQIYLNWSGTTLSSLTQTLGTATFTAVGNSWYRVSITFTAVEATPRFRIFAGDNLTTTGVIFIWGTQAEVGSTTNTYIPTTTTAVYGTPTLSFSGVSTIGLQSDGSLYVSPAGTGAVQAQPTTGVASTGGNARGANAVDWQTSRASASQVASSSFSTIGGGANNTASTSNGTTIAGGRNNTSSAQDSFVGGGNSNTASGLFSSSVGGLGNIASGYYGFVGNGNLNSTTSNSAVTTQSGTMNATTAVTLSGSNASIKVGQLITGTSISTTPNTYVAAISGTALTLSQAASGSSTSTLSFFTPHGVVVGGGNNQATGSYSFIGGGGDAGTAANRNTASGDWSAIVGGLKNTASGAGASVLGGYGHTASNAGAVVTGGGYNSSGAVSTGNTASAINSTVIGGLGNNASGLYSTIFGGYNNQANGQFSIAWGYGANTRSVFASNAFSSAYFSSTGDSQTAVYQLAILTTNATTTELVSGGATNSGNVAATTTIPVLPAPSASTSSVYTFRGLVSGKNTATTDAAGWEIKGVIQRTGALASTVALVGTPTVTLLGANAGAIAAGWGLVANVTVTADTTYGGISVNVIGAASTNIRWNCRLETSELG